MEARSEATGRRSQFAIIGRKGRDYFTRRKAPIVDVLPAASGTSLDLETGAQASARGASPPFVKGEVDAIYLVYNEFKSAMTQKVVGRAAAPARAASGAATGEGPSAAARRRSSSSRTSAALLERLVPMYVEISIYRALLESHGVRARRAHDGDGLRDARTRRT